jgi:hypothetical protein
MKKGQVVLIVLLISTVLMTIGMSMSKRTVTETKINTDEELLKKAFNAAESGLEMFMGTGETAYETEDKSSVAIISTNDMGGDTDYVMPEVTLPGKSAYFWLVSHTINGDIGATYYTGGTIKLCAEEGFNGGVKIDFFYKDVANNYQIERWGFNMGSGDAGVDGFTDCAAEICSNNNLCIDNIATGTKPILMVFTPIASSTRFTINGMNFFPLQGQEVVSMGQAGDLETLPINRQVTVKNVYSIPSFMLEAITAGGDVSN